MEAWIRRATLAASKSDTYLLFAGSLVVLGFEKVPKARFARKRKGRF